MRALLALTLALLATQAEAESFSRQIERLSLEVAERLRNAGFSPDNPAAVYVRPPFDDVYRVVCPPLSRRLSREMRAALPDAFLLKQLNGTRTVVRQRLGSGQTILNLTWRRAGEERVEFAFQLGDLSTEAIADLGGGRAGVALSELSGPERDCLARIQVINRVETAEETLYIHRSADVFSAEIGVIEMGARYRLLGRMPYTNGDWAVVKPLDGAPDDPFAETVGFASVPPTPSERQASEAEARAAEEARLAQERAAAEAETERLRAEERRREAERRLEAAKRREAARQAEAEGARAAEAQRAREAEAERARKARQAEEEAARRAEIQREAERLAARRAAEESTRRTWPETPPPSNRNQRLLVGAWICEGQQATDAFSTLNFSMQVQFLPDASYAMNGTATLVANFNGQAVNQMAVSEYGRYRFERNQIAVTPQGSVPPVPLAPYQVTVEELGPYSLRMVDYAQGSYFDCERSG
ncbi:MAG: hypothetical protein AAGI34_13390 [Pseudomonadota bacterium]